MMLSMELLIPGAKAPKLVQTIDVSQMRPRFSHVDVAKATKERCYRNSRPCHNAHGTSFTKNMACSTMPLKLISPGAVARTYYRPLPMTLPYVGTLADNGFHKATLDEGFCAKVSLLPRPYHKPTCCYWFRARLHTNR